MLRELRELVGNEHTNKIDMCLLVAKKMDDKLKENAGRNYTRKWYDEDGNFIV
jgi:hypothetical protein